MCKTVTSEAIQVHGGIGFTWEHDMHLFYRRGLASEAAFGSAPTHREVVAQTLGFVGPALKFDLYGRGAALLRPYFLDL